MKGRKIVDNRESRQLNYDLRETLHSGRLEDLVGMTYNLTIKCDHEWTEGVDEDGQPIEPPYDICIHCGERRD